MTNHTPEPWKVKTNKLANVVSIQDATGAYIAGTGNALENSEKLANAARIVQCVNACAGIENPEALPDVIRELRNLLSYGQSKDSQDATIVRAFNALAKLNGEAVTEGKA
ncbi:MAG TPA: hypothetical protein VN081_03800 [Dongiaceae bacterium]|nr:hypothetical protein [Dongiaceae bacterium]